MIDFSKLDTSTIETMAINIGIIFLAVISLSFVIISLLKMVKIPNKLLDNIIGFIVIGVGIGTVYYSIRWDILLGL